MRRRMLLREGNARSMPVQAEIPVIPCGWRETIFNPARQGKPRRKAIAGFETQYDAVDSALHLIYLTHKLIN